MVLNVAGALSAYKQSGGLLDAGASAASSPAGGESFGDMVKSFTGDAVSALHEGEKGAASAVSGKANLANIATAIDNAEVLLTEITTIRDKAITAYQTITGSAI